MRTPEPHASSDDVTTYKVRFRLKGKQSSETFDTKREAEQAATVPTLDQVAADHIEHLTSVTDGTRLDYSRLWVYTLKELFRYILKKLFISYAAFICVRASETSFSNASTTWEPACAVNGTGWDNHRWIRFRTTTDGRDAWPAGFHRRYKFADSGRIRSDRLVCPWR